VEVTDWPAIQELGLGRESGLVTESEPGAELGFKATEQLRPAKEGVDRREGRQGGLDVCSRMRGRRAWEDDQG
jgi:hypothetical protein